MIEVQELVKWYGPVLAVDHLTFSIPEGRIVGFLGPNGAGKTTTIRMLTGYLPPTSGRATIAGFDVLKQADDARKMIGYLPQATPLYPEMRVDEYLHYRGKLHGMKRTLRKKRIEELTDRCGLKDIIRRVIGYLSGGNQQRVGLAQALLHDPKVLILDEPTAGFDPTQTHQVRQLIRVLKDKHTILLSTHILPEAEMIADDAIIIAGGRIVARGSPQELRKNVGTRGAVLIEVKAAHEAVTRAMKQVQGVENVTTETQPGGWCRATVTSNNGKDLREPLGHAIVTNGWQVREMRHEAATLEQFFIQITATQQTQPAATGA